MFTNLQECLVFQGTNSDNGIYFIENGKDIYVSYKELLSNAKKACKQLYDEGAREGDFVILQLQRPIDFVTVFWGGILGGFVPVPVTISTTNESSLRMKEIQKSFDKSYVITNETILPLVKQQFVLGDNCTEILFDYDNLQLMDEQVDFLPVSSEQDDIAFIQFSSGSTGSPKGVINSHKNILFNCCSMQTSANVTRKDVFADWLPLTHNMGLVTFHILPMTKGLMHSIMAPEIFLRTPLKWIEKIGQYKATFVGSPNFGFKMCIESLKKCQLSDDLDLSSIRIFINGAEPISSEICKRFVMLFSKYKMRENVMVPAYGLTEAGLGATVSLVGDEVKALYLDRSSLGLCDKVSFSDKESGFEVVSLGQQLYMNKIRIVNDKGFELPEGYIGLIQMTGDNITKGYYKNDEANKVAFEEDGWFNTGDMGFFQNNFLYITGRFKEMILINGCNYYLYDIDRVVQSFFKGKVQLNIAQGIYNFEIKTEELMIFIKLEENIDFNAIAADISKEIERAIGIRAAAIVEVESIPITANGKVQRFVLKEKFETNELAYKNILYTEKHNKTDNSVSIRSYITKEIANILDMPASEINENTPFSELGMTSIEMEQVLYNIEQKINKPLDVSEMWNYPTIKQLADHLNESSANTFNNSKPEEENISGGNIAVIGMACDFPGGSNNPKQYFENLLNKKDCIIDAQKDRRKLFGVNVTGKFKGGYIENIDKFDTKKFSLNPKESVKIDPQQRLLLMKLDEAFLSTKIPMEKIIGSDTGVFIGLANNDYSHILNSSGHKTDIYASTGNASSIASNRLSYFYNLCGPSMTIDTACSSSLVAIHEACLNIKNKECDMAVAGGVNLILSDEISEAFKEGGMLSPDSKCKTFDAAANGYVRGEGCGVIILKSLEKAIKDKNDIYAVINGSAVNQDGKSNGLTAPNGIAQQQVIQKAIVNSGIKQDDVNYIETHGTGTKLGDPIEVNSLSKIYTEGRKIDNPCFLGSVKTNIGHLEAASGMASIIKTIAILIKNKIPPNLHYTMLNPYIKTDNSLIVPATEVLLEKRKEKVKYAAISAFGFGGTNAHMILSAYDKAPAELPSNNSIYELKSYWIKGNDDIVNNQSQTSNKLRKEMSVLDREKRPSSVVDLFIKQTEVMKQMNNILNGEAEIPNNLVATMEAQEEVALTKEVVDNNIITVNAVSSLIIDIISKLTGYDEKDITLDSHVSKDLGFDSIMAGRLVVEIIKNYPILKGKSQDFIKTINKIDVTVQVIIDYVLKELSSYYEIENGTNDYSYANEEQINNKELDKSSYIFTESLEYKNLIKTNVFTGGNNPYFKVNSGVARDVMNINGKDYINFTTYNYVGLNGREEVIDAVTAAIKKYGTSVSGSRLLSGEIPIHRELENEIADFLGTEDTIVYVGGHSANLNTIGHFVSKGDLILHDSLSHNSIIEGCMLSGATRRNFLHNDMEDLENILSKVRNKFNKVLIVVEGIYSMDGDICPLQQLIEIKKKYKAFLMVDEAHSLGTIGRGGRGVGDYAKVNPKDVDLWMGTLSKSLASCGGYISGSKELVKYLKYTSPGFVFSCGITPSNTAASLAALRLLKKEPELITKLEENSKLFLSLAKEAGFDTGNSGNTPIIPVMIKDSNTAMKLTKKLFERGINVMPIVYPAVSEDLVRFRFFMSSLHTKKEIEYTIKVLKEELENIDQY